MIVTLLHAVAQAYRELSKTYECGKTTDEMLESFKMSLKGSLGEYSLALDFLWGEDTVKIDGITKCYTPQSGDAGLIDVSVGKDGVWCDVCRTFFVGGISDSQRKAFEMVRESLRAGQAAMKAGAGAGDVYEAVNSVYARHGKKLIHHAGHAVGSEPVMQPRFTEGCQLRLEEGIYTVESGLYEDFGIRLENDFLVSGSGATDLFEQLLPLEEEEYILK